MAWFVLLPMRYSTAAQTRPEIEMKFTFDFLVHVNTVVCFAWLAFYSDLTWVRGALGAASVPGVIDFWQWLRMITKDRQIPELT
jgi:hypothetical protein